MSGFVCSQKEMASPVNMLNRANRGEGEWEQTQWMLAGSKQYSGLTLIIGLAKERCFTVLGFERSTKLQQAPLPPQLSFTLAGNVTLSPS